MLELGESATRKQGLQHRVEYFLARLPDAQLPEKRYDILISNSLLHHLQNPATLWHSIVRFGRPGAIVFIMDLQRPHDPEQAQRLVSEYATDEPGILQTDFYNSLLAAYRPDEVKTQLKQHQLGQLEVESVSDRHMIVFGRLSDGGGNSKNTVPL
jgi:2-polyprenyl-3-methyl-5-hydroxy-6-metoxy-1,4-benzoquinol methylase